LRRRSSHCQWETARLAVLGKRRRVALPAARAGRCLSRWFGRRTTGAELAQLEAVADGGTVLALQRLARQVPVSDLVWRYTSGVILATHPEDERATAGVKKHLLYGASPRGLQAVILAAKITALLDGRKTVSLEDVRQAALPALRHRVILNYEAQAEGINPDDLITEVLADVPAR
ncbi:MAG: hypothetical protein IT318_15365, partial [Anaerolineales bacterium]|nr:hypothetical protein [Anaerolineales bacterium]